VNFNTLAPDWQAPLVWMISSTKPVSPDSSKFSETKKRRLKPAIGFEDQARLDNDLAL